MTTYAIYYAKNKVKLKKKRMDLCYKNHEEEKEKKRRYRENNIEVYI